MNARQIKDLKNFLGAVKLLGKNKNIPALSCLAFEKNIVRATDLDNHLILSLHTGINACVDIKTIQSVLNFNPPKIRFNPLPENRMEIEYNGHKIIVPVLPIEDYPKIPKGRFKSVGIWSESAINFLQNQSRFVSNDELKPALTGVYFKLNHAMESCATNGHYLFIHKSADPDCEVYNPADGIISRNTIRLLSCLKSGVRIYRDKTKLSPLIKFCSLNFELNNITLISHLIDEQYPDYQAVIPKEMQYMISFDRKKMINLLQEALFFASPTNHTVVLNFEKNKILITAKNPSFKIEWQANFPIKCIAPIFSIGVNANYFQDILKIFDDDTVTIKLNSPVSPILFCSQKEQVDTILLMPIKLEE